MSSRSRILDRLKNGRFVPDAKNDNNSSLLLAAPIQTKQNRISQFEKGLAIANAEIRYCKEGEEVLSLIDWIAQIGKSKCWISDETDLGKQLWQNKPENAEWSNPQEPMDSDRYQVFNEIEVSVTETHSAIAETGTLVIIPDLKEPRTMSLVPPIHIAVVRLDTLVPRFEDWVVQNTASEKHTNVLFITGPSKTADIQQTLAYGAHGPKRLLVLLVE